MIAYGYSTSDLFLEILRFFITDVMKKVLLATLA
jgi:hypothetical protein